MGGKICPKMELNLSHPLPPPFCAGGNFWKNAAFGEWVIFLCLEGDYKNLRENIAWGHE